MKTGEIKLRLLKSVSGLVDTYFGAPTLTEKMLNATLKVILKQNINKIDPMLMLFADENGEINPREILMEYANQVDDNGIVVDIQEYVKNETLKQILPNKILIIKKEDIMNLIV